MTWLKKIGTALLKALPIVLGIAPLFQNLAPAGSPASNTIAKVVGDLNGIPQLVVTAETLFASAGTAKTGSQKLAAIAPSVQQLITEYVTANMPGATKVVNPALLATASAQIASSFADVLNSFGA